jgi:exo-beta-1,3-glucanase (GH17 family)/cellulose synthase/poly-beta-1,6-N-acetylglucosamine synthase-like glycosyltransferase
MRLTAVVCALVAAAHAGVWAISERKASAPDVPVRLSSVSYTPFDGSAHPDRGTRTTSAQIHADLQALTGVARSVRTYSSTNGSEKIAGIAGRLGLQTSVGAWIDKDTKRNEAEMRNAIELAGAYSSVTSVVVGNETIYRADQTVEELIKKIERVKKETSVPVTTGEIWNVWLEHPELVQAVDYIAAHILPYWEGINEAEAVDQAMRIYDRLRTAYPGKRIVIAEFGWPSAGHNRRAAVPGRIEQARVLREFVDTAHRRGIEYNIIEAYDQPWKTFEGGVGPYWGMLDTTRTAKFSWTGAIEYPGYSKLMVLALLLGTLLSIPALLIRGATARQLAVLSVAAHSVGAWCAYVFEFWNAHYFVTGAAIAFGVGTVLLIPLIVTALYRIEEIAALAFGRKPARLISEPLPLKGPLPKVSIHIPACREQPEMVKATLESVARLDYPSLECIVVVNNTPDPAMWQPIEAHCKLLGGRFKFLREDKLEGFKAGALRLALQHTDPDAAIIGVLDADYVVTESWLRDLMPAFADPLVGIVQAPQDHRDSGRSVMHHAMNAEYAGFFDIGMVHRNEVGGVVVHGTMCLIRRAALESAGGWSSDTICEDTDLGLSIIERGWTAHYTNRRYGHGLLPDTYQSFKRQRHRWAYGGMQIARKHWKSFLPGRSLLSQEQRRAFLVGWISWLGGESMGVLVALLNLALVPFVVLANVIVPDKVLTLPILATFAVTMAHFLVLYTRKVKVDGLGLLGALLASMSVQWTISRAVAAGVIKDSLPFVVTAKGGAAKRAASFPAFWEGLIGLALAASAAIVHKTNYERVVEIELLAIVLVVQSLPFIAAFLLAGLEASRINDFAVWRGVRVAAARFGGKFFGGLQKAPAKGSAMERGFEGERRTATDTTVR